jgi:hypothetical protein
MIVGNVATCYYELCLDPSPLPHKQPTTMCGICEHNKNPLNFAWTLAMTMYWYLDKLTPINYFEIWNHRWCSRLHWKKHNYNEVTLSFQPLLYSTIEGCTSWSSLSAFFSIRFFQLIAFHRKHIFFPWCLWQTCVTYSSYPMKRQWYLVFTFIHVMNNNCHPQVQNQT